jgi:hypothetical protein
MKNILTIIMVTLVLSSASFSCKPRNDAAQEQDPQMLNKDSSMESQNDSDVRDSTQHQRDSSAAH